MDEKIKRRIAAPPYFLYISGISRISETNICTLFRKSKLLRTFLKNRVKVYLKSEILVWSDIFTFGYI